MEPTTATSSRPLACVVMAGGMGTRMKSKRTKVLHRLCGRTILGWVLAAAREADADPLVVVTPREAEDVRKELRNDERPAIQHPALGTGHAVQCGMEELQGFEGDVLVVSGDTPL